MIDNTSNLRPQIGLLQVKHIMINQGNLIDSFSRWILLPELIVEVKLALVDLAVLEMEDYLKITVEVGSVAVNDWDPLLVKLFGIVVGKADRSHSRVNITASIAQHNTKTVRVLLRGPQRSRCDSLLSST